MNWGRRFAIGLVLGVAAGRGILLLPLAYRLAVIPGLLVLLLAVVAFNLFELRKANRTLDQARQRQERIEANLQASDRSRAAIDETLRMVRENLPHHNPFPPSRN